MATELAAARGHLGVERDDRPVLDRGPHGTLHQGEPRLGVHGRRHVLLTDLEGAGWCRERLFGVT